MSGDERRDRQKSQVRSPSTSSRENGTSNASGHVGRDTEFEAPTRPRGRTVSDAELADEALASMSAPAVRPSQDSFHPVRVSARSVRPAMSSWARMWATFALVIVVAGGAVGILASLRAHTLNAGDQRAHDDDARAAPGARTRTLRMPETSSELVAPAAAPGLAAPLPVAPNTTANRNAAASAASSETVAVASSTGAAREASSAVAFRTLDSLAREVRAVSPPRGATPPAASTPSIARRTKPADPAPTGAEAPPEASGHVPAPDPATSETPEDKGESEAWVTEERRF